MGPWAAVLSAMQLGLLWAGSRGCWGWVQGLLGLGLGPGAAGGWVQGLLGAVVALPPMSSHDGWLGLGAGVVATPVAVDVVENQFATYIEGWLYAVQVVNIDMSEYSLRVCGDGWFILCALIAQCTTGVQLVCSNPPTVSFSLLLLLYRWDWNTPPQCTV